MTMSTATRSLLFAIASTAFGGRGCVMASSQPEMLQHPSKADEVTSTNASPQQQEQQRRDLQAFDFFDIMVDVCDNNPDSSINEGAIPDLGRCDVTRFPQCDEGKEEICYNRKPSRDHFDPITHEPLFYIQYDRVFCYPNTWGGCSSCSPGRYCASEKRCILDDLTYPCAQWF